MKKVYIAPMMELHRLATTASLLSGSSTLPPTPEAGHIGFDDSGTNSSGLVVGW